MTAARSAGLVSAGGTGLSVLRRLPAALATLGPVKAASFRVARRIANSLGAGFPVRGYSALEPCALIWVAVPEPMLDRVIGDLMAHIRVEGKIVVLYGAARDSPGPSALRAAAARVASFHAVDKTGGSILVAEGHAQAIRSLRRLARAGKRKLIEIRPASKPLYFAGLHLASHLVPRWIGAAVESLRAAGFSRPDATRLVETLATRAVRTYVKAGRNAWSRRTAYQLRRALDRDMDALRAADPHVAVLFAEGIASAVGYFESAPAGRRL